MYLLVRSGKRSEKVKLATRTGNLCLAIISCVPSHWCASQPGHQARIFCNYSLGKNLFSIVRSDTACKKFLFGDYNHFSLRKRGRRGKGGGCTPWGDTPGNLWWGCAARFLQILTLFQTKKYHFCKKIMPLLLRLEQQHKRFLKIHFEFAYFSFFLTHLELKLWIRSYTLVVPSKTIPDSGQKWAKSIHVFRPQRRKNPTL